MFFVPIGEAYRNKSGFRLSVRFVSVPELIKELTATEKLKYRIAVKMTAADYFRLLTRSHEAGVSPSEYMRECFRNGHVKERLSEEHAGYIRQLCGMANNLNQLARKANAGGFHDERWDCKVAVARIHELITKIGI